MRNRISLVLIVLLCLAVVSVAIAGPTVTVSKTAIQRLDELNEILEEILDGLSDGTMGPDEFDELLDEAFDAFYDVLDTMPVAGLLFTDVFSALYAILDELTLAAVMFDAYVPGPYPYYVSILKARYAKDDLLWAASGGLIQTQLGCAQGKALVMVYPGFDCHALRAKLDELRAAGKCVTVGWKEPPCYEPDPNVAFDGPTAMQLFECFGISYPVGPMFELDSLIEPDAPGFSEYHTFGDPNADCHVSQTPRSVHETYVDSTLALDVSGGEPIRYDPNQAFSVGDVVKPWYKVKDVCSPLAVDWLIYGPAGTPAYAESSTLDPANSNTDCFSNFSSAGWVTLDRSSFGMAGTYTVELWLGGTHCANHTFQMAGSGNQPPYVNHDVYAMDEDSILAVNDRGVLNNDFDPNSDPLMTSVDEGPQHGTLTLNPDGTFTYAPSADYYGADWFTYTATDPDGLSGAGQVTILVKPVNDPPVAGDDVYDVVVSPDERTWSVSAPGAGWTEEGSFVEDGAFITIPPPGLLLNDRDPDNDVLAVVADIPGTRDDVVIDVQDDGGLGISIPSPSTLDRQGTEIEVHYQVLDGAGSSDQAKATIHVEVE